MKPVRLVALLLLAAGTATFAGTQSAQSAADSVNENVLRGHLSFLASDALEGRGTPSRGLDLAAEYIAAQFRIAGLEPVNGSYFQLARDSRANKEGEPTVKNVVGLLKGSDPALADTYIIVSAHYDHLGIRPNVQGDDKLFNGANDDGSGTVSVVTIAQSIAKAGVRPKRSVLFMCFFGEERGLLGSNYYGDHPLLPLEKTVCNLNIEMDGRTRKFSAAPDKQGVIEDWTGRLGVTGYDYTDMGARLTASCRKAGIAAVMDKDASDPFFMRSDNRALAARGIPAHTVSVGYEDPEYHQANDEWQTVDYSNMTKVVKALVFATLDLANDSATPKWNPAKEQAKPYAEAWAKMHPNG